MGWLKHFFEFFGGKLGFCLTRSFSASTCCYKASCRALDVHGCFPSGHLPSLQWASHCSSSIFLLSGARLLVFAASWPIFINILLLPFHYPPCLSCSWSRHHPDPLPRALPVLLCSHRSATRAALGALRSGYPFHRGRETGVELVSVCDG